MRRVPRLHLARRWVPGLLAALVLLLPAGTAAGHGGSFQKPPPPPPRNPNPPWNAPRGHRPTAVMPGIGGPMVTPGDGGGPQSVGPVGRRKRPVTPTRENSWPLWWRLNGGRITPERRARRVERAVVTPGGEATVPPLADTMWVERRDGLVRSRVVPLLLRLLDPKTRVPNDVRASAAIALGKLAFAPEHGDVLLAWMLDDDASSMVRESAALGIGLLRRTEASRQLPAFRLDTLRGTLLQVFDRHMGGRRLDVPERTRYFALFALGLLGDQPFQEDPQSADGRLMTSLLWQRLTRMRHKGVDAPIAIVTAIGLQPPAGVDAEVIDGLNAMALGKKVGERDYKAWVGGHALTALTRVGGARGRTVAIRALGDPRTDPERRVAAILAIAHVADQMTQPERHIALRMATTASRQDQQLLLAGLLDVALGRLLAADLREGGKLFQASGGPQLLLERADRGAWYLQGFSLMGLAIAAAPADTLGPEGAAWRVRVRNLLLSIAQNDDKKELPPRTAALLGLGVARLDKGQGTLLATVRNPLAAPELRGAAALGLAHLGASDAEVSETLAALVTDPDAKPDLRAQASLALSAYGHADAVDRLLEELERSHRTWHVAAVTAALGRLGDLRAVEPLIALAGDAEQNEVVRALAVVALGILGDPEATPSLVRLVGGTPYPIRTNALEEVFTIL